MTPVLGKAAYTYAEFSNWPHPPRDVEWLVDGAFPKLGGDTTVSVDKFRSGPHGSGDWRVTLHFIPSHIGETVDVQTNEHVANSIFEKSSLIGEHGCEVQLPHSGS